MSEKVKEAAQKAAGQDPEQLVDYHAPIDPMGESRDITVGVNGEFIRIQRGKDVQIKRKFLEVLQNADAQEMAAREARDKAVKSSEKAIYDL